MSDEQSQSYQPSHPLRWFPEFLQLSRARFEAQGRVLSAAILVGIVAGLGAVVFSVACNVVLFYTLGTIANFWEAEPPHNEKVVNTVIQPLLIGGPQKHLVLERVLNRTSVDNAIDLFIIPDERDELLDLAEPLSDGSGYWAYDIVSDPIPWLLILIPTIGGVISGWIVFTFAPEAEGHGTDGAIAAYHHRQGYIRPRVPIIKIIASAITIGTGGSGGREGPIAQIGAGFGSLLSRILNMRPAERRILLAAGVGAGVAAIFRAPLAGALFAAEVLYRKPEFESEVIIPAGMASVVSYCTYGMFFGWESLFVTPELKFENPLRLLPYFLLAVAMAMLAMVYTRTFYGINHLFKKLPIRNHWKPAIGAFLSSVFAVGIYVAWKLTIGEHAIGLLSMMSFGYGILQESLITTHSMEKIGPTILILVALGKIITTSLTIGSGGSGGVFGPSMVIGGCAGGALGLILNSFWVGMVDPASFMIVGMAGFFAAAGKVPLSTLIIVCEMTGDYFLLLPALWVCALSYLLSDEQSLYQSQVETRSMSPAHKGEYVKEVLAGLQVNQFVKANNIDYLVHPEDSLPTVIDKLSDSPFSVLPVVDDSQKLLGVVVLEEVHVASQSPNASPWLIAADLMRSNLRPLPSDSSLDEAQEIFVQNDLVALPVVDNNKRVIGIVKRSDISRIYLRHVHGTPSEERIFAD